MSNLPILVIDARMVTEVPHGISRYVTALARGLDQLNQSKPLPYKPVFLTSNIDRRRFYSFPTLPVRSPFLSPWEILEIPRALKAVEAALYHSPSFSSLILSPCPTLVTIHDLNHLTYGNASQKLYYRLILRHFALHSALTMTVSKFSRKEISNWLGIQEEKIPVIYNVIERNKAASASAQSIEKLGLKPGQYFLCLSNPKPHKNLGLLLEAYAQFKKMEPQAWPLVIGLKADEVYRLAQGVTVGLEAGIVAHGPLHEDQVPAFLDLAGGVLFPSLYEGFGLPPVEAAASGVPIAVSDIPPHHEGLADLKADELMWVRPNHLEGWIEAFRQLQTRKVLPPSQGSQGRILQRFSLERMAEGMDRIYRLMLERKK